MSQTTAGRWVRLQDGERFVGDLWPGSDERQRRETLISTLWSGKVPMRARMAAKPRDADLEPALPTLERLGVLGTSAPVPGIETVLLQADPRTLNVDIPAGRIVISGFIANDDKGLWAPFFPGWHTTAAGRFIVIEFDAVEFDRAAGHAYVVENLLPDGASPSEEGTAAAELDPAEPQLGGYVIPGPYRTGLAGRPTSWALSEAECRRRYAQGERHRTRAEWARVLITWLQSTHSDAPVLREKSLTNKLAELLRELEASGGPPAF
jgi:hypothetical protein